MFYGHNKSRITMKVVLTTLLKLAIIAFFALLIAKHTSSMETEPEIAILAQPEPITEVIRVIKARVTGYNTVSAQTDSTPCLAAGNNYICGRDDVVACPRSIPLNTKVKINGKIYECLDRLAKKYDNRFDISCDKDMECPYKVTGIFDVEILK